MISIFIGIFIGFVSIFIKHLIYEVQYYCFNTRNENLLNILPKLPWYVKIFSPCIGGLIVGILFNTIFKDSSGDGVEKVMISVATKGGKLKMPGVLGRIIGSAISVGSGGSTGREGPIIHIAGGIASSLGQIFSFNQESLKILVGVGVASGIASVFNAPIAGTFFAVEIILGDFAIRTLTPIILSSVSATVVSGYFIEPIIPFEKILQNYTIRNPLELLEFVLLGIITSISSIFFIKNLILSEEFFNNLNIPKFLKPAFGGLCVGLIGFQIPEIMGLGYDAIANIIQTSNEINILGSPWIMLFLFFIFKTISTGLTLSSGGSGGTLIPSLFLGCVVGKLYGIALENIFPEADINSSVYSIIGMSGLLSGTTQAPIMCIMLFFEFTNNYQIVVPVVITSFISTLFTKYTFGYTIYTIKLKKLGINVYDVLEKTIMSNISISEIMTKNTSYKIFKNTNIKRSLDLFYKLQTNILFVINEKEELIGTLKFFHVKSILNQENAYNNTIDSIMEKTIRYVLPTDSLSRCMKIFSSIEEGVLPIIQSEENFKLIGIIDQKRIWYIYNIEVKKNNEQTMRFSSKVGDVSKKGYIDFSANYRFESLPVPAFFIGKKLGDLNIRKDYEITIFTIVRKDESKHTLASPNTIFHKDDYIVIAGEHKNLNKFLDNVDY